MGRDGLQCLFSRKAHGCPAPCLRAGAVPVSLQLRLQRSEARSRVRTGMPALIPADAPEHRRAGSALTARPLPRGGRSLLGYSFGNGTSLVNFASVIGLTALVQWGALLRPSPPSPRLKHRFLWRICPELNRDVT